MRILGSVVAPSTSLVALRDPQFTGCSPIRSEIIRDELIWDKAVFLQKLAHEFQRHPFVPFRLDQHVEDLALGIHSAPKIDYAAIDFQIDPSKCQVVCGLGRRWRRSAAILGPKWFTQRRMVS